MASTVSWKVPPPRAKPRKVPARAICTLVKVHPLFACLPDYTLSAGGRADKGSIWLRGPMLTGKGIRDESQNPYQSGEPEDEHLSSEGWMEVAHQ